MICGVVKICSVSTLKFSDIVIPLISHKTTIEIIIKTKQNIMNFTKKNMKALFISKEIAKTT